MLVFFNVAQFLILQCQRFSLDKSLNNTNFLLLFFVTNILILLTTILTIRTQHVRV